MTYETANKLLTTTTVFESSNFVPDEKGNPCWVYFTGEVLAHWHVSDLPRVFDLMRAIK